MHAKAMGEFRITLDSAITSLSPKFGQLIAESKRKMYSLFGWSSVSVRIQDSAIVAAKD